MRSSVRFLFGASALPLLLLFSGCGGGAPPSPVVADNVADLDNVAFNATDYGEATDGNNESGEHGHGSHGHSGNDEGGGASNRTEERVEPGGEAGVRPVDHPDLPTGPIPQTYRPPPPPPPIYRPPPPPPPRYRPPVIHGR